MSIPVFKVILTLMNFGILSFLIMLMVDHYNANYSLMSWSSCFHILSLSWLSIKGVFWLLTITSDYEWEAIQFYILYWLPAPLEFGSYMLVPLFFGQVLYPDLWAAHSYWVLPSYGVATLVLILFMVTWAVLAATEATTWTTRPANTASRWSLAAMSSASSVPVVSSFSRASRCSLR